MVLQATRKKQKRMWGKVSVVCWESKVVVTIRRAQVRYVVVEDGG